MNTLWRLTGVSTITGAFMVEAIRAQSRHEIKSVASVAAVQIDGIGF